MDKEEGLEDFVSAKEWWSCRTEGSISTMPLFICFSFALHHLKRQKSINLYKMKLAVLRVAGFYESNLAGSPVEQLQ